MVTIHKMNNREYCETAEFQFSGLSTDDKPTEWHGFPVGENSLFFEEDTGDFYYFSEGSWAKVGG